MLKKNTVIFFKHKISTQTLFRSAFFHPKNLPVEEFFWQKQLKPTAGSKDCQLDYTEAENGIYRISRLYFEAVDLKKES